MLYATSAPLAPSPNFTSPTSLGAAAGEILGSGGKPGKDVKPPKRESPKDLELPPYAKLFEEELGKSNTPGIPKSSTLDFLSMFNPFL